MGSPTTIPFTTTHPSPPLNTGGWARRLKGLTEAVKRAGSEEKELMKTKKQRENNDNYEIKKQIKLKN